jgi:predicted transcriptional regulator
VFSLTGAVVKLSKAHQHILKSIYGGCTLKSHRYLDGTKIYQLHPLNGNTEIVSRVTVDYLKEHGLIDSNKKFPAATYLLTPKGQRMLKEIET